MEKTTERLANLVSIFGRKRPANHNHGCSVKGCMDGQLVTVAGDEKGFTLMCVRHATAWARSSACRDVAQHNSGASMGSLAGWVGAQS